MRFKLPRSKRRSRALTSLLAAVSAALLSGLLAEAQSNLAFVRARHLKRGINLSTWYAQDPDLYTPTGGADKLASYTTVKDFQLIRSLGFDHVRLSIDPQPLIAEPLAGTLRPEAMARLDATVQQIISTGLIVVLDIHPETPWKHAVTMTPMGEQELLVFWRHFAQHYAKSDPRRVYLEVLNEPEGVDPHSWDREQSRAVAIIRQQAPRHTIIVTGVKWGNIDGLRRIKLLRDKNVIYSFHDYEPLEFSSQGATWDKKTLVALRNVPYPSTPQNIAPLLPPLKDVATRNALTRYGQQRWNAKRMARRVGLAAAWAKQRHVPLWCGEFGVYLQYAPPADRDRWIADMRKTFEHRGIGWNMWDYQSNFGLVSKNGSTTAVDKGVAKALGIGR
jgi:endoglucanase